jgi:hypothetical protein
VGAIEPLKEVYPDLKVVVHETETPYLIGGTDYSCYDYLPEGLSTGFKLLMWLRFIPPFYQYKVGVSLDTVGAYVLFVLMLGLMLLLIVPAKGFSAS